MVGSGPGQAFLYPPYVLPLLVPVALLPVIVVTAAWSLVSLGLAVWSCRRLGIPWWACPLALTWPPFAEALLGLNVQVVLFAAFVALFFGPARAAWHPAERDVGGVRRPAAVDGILAVSVGAFKISQPHAWIYVLRRRPRAAMQGLLAAGVLVAATLPLTGWELWVGWLAQVTRAAQPGIGAGGISLVHDLPLPLGATLAGASVALLWAVPRRHAGAWVGLLTVLGAPDLHVFGLLFAVPALLVVRREIGLLAAFSIALFTTWGSWIGVLLVAGALLASRWWPSLLEPDPEPQPALSGVRDGR